MYRRLIEKCLEIVFKSQAIECGAGKPKRSAKAIFLNPFFVFSFISIGKTHLIPPILV